MPCAHAGSVNFLLRNGGSDGEDTGNGKWRAGVV